MPQKSRRFNLFDIHKSLEMFVITEYPFSPDKIKCFPDYYLVIIVVMFASKLIIYRKS